MATAGQMDDRPVVLITGCSNGGIGAALVFEFSKRGFHVVATSRSLSTMTVFEGHKHVALHSLDLLSEESIKAAVEFVMVKYGRIDILVNNAAMPCVAPIAEVPIATVEKVHRTNYLGLGKTRGINYRVAKNAYKMLYKRLGSKRNGRFFFLTHVPASRVHAGPVMLIQAVVPHMVARGRGKIVNVGSIVSLAAGPFNGAYSASKAALQCSTDALRLEMKPFNIDVMLLLPGAVVTGIAQNGAEVVKSYFGKLQIFKAYEEYLLNRTNLTNDPKSTPAPVFAEKAVAAILAASTPPCFVYGFLSRSYRILYYCPYWIRDWFFISKMPDWMKIKKLI